MVRALASVFALSLGLSASACGRSQGGSSDTPSTIAIDALRHELFAAGIQPLPAAPVVSDELFELGQALFFDKVLSGSEDVSCATCHLPQFATADGRNLSDGVRGIGLGPIRGGGAMIPRNSPALLALHLKSDLFWDGRVRSHGGQVEVPNAVPLTDEMRAAFSPGLEALAAQAMLPPVSREEMRGVPGENPLGDLGDGYNSVGGTDVGTRTVWEQLTERLLDIPAYVQLLRAAYPGVALQDFTFAHAGNAIAAFETRAFARTDSPFERFVRGDDTAMTGRQVRGALAFFGAGCAQCHTGSQLSDQDYHNIGLPQIGPGVAPVSLVALPPTVFPGWDFGREAATGLPADRFLFRTPSLLNVALTGPWGHAGQFADLRDFVAHYRDPERSNREYDIQSNVFDPELVTMLTPNSDAVLQTLDPRLQALSAFDVGAVVDFLHALTADDARDLADIVPSSVPSRLPIF